MSVQSNMKRYNVSEPSSYKDALEQIMKVCSESSDYSRRVQTIFSLAMCGLGLTANQREILHTRAMMRSEQYKEDRRIVGESKAKKVLRETIKGEEE